MALVHHLPIIFPNKFFTSIGRRVHNFLFQVKFLTKIIPAHSRHFRLRYDLLTGKGFHVKNVRKIFYIKKKLISKISLAPLVKFKKKIETKFFLTIILATVSKLDFLNDPP